MKKLVFVKKAETLLSQSREIISSCSKVLGQFRPQKKDDDSFENSGVSRNSTNNFVPVCFKGQVSTDTIMKHRCAIALFCNVMLILSFSPCLHAGDGSRTLLVHYMPWYSSKSVSGRWGWHWTMDHFNPDRVRSNGQREVASHDYPLIDLYDSNDPHALECHVLLMKFAGIEGAVIDWYGREDFRDYAAIHRNTQHLIKYIKMAGLQFAICYEDQTVKHMLEGRFLQKQGDVAHGKQVLKWLDDNWFGDDAYVKIDGRPVLLVFGPQYFKQEQWHHIMSGLFQRPFLYGLPHLWRKAGADGAFGWPPVTGGREVVSDVWRKYLRTFYARGTEEAIIAVAFPAFHDIYKEAGVHDSFGYIDDQEGKTFAETLDLAWKSNSRLIQLATWNDYGEGTVIEPTKTFGYQYLQVVQQYAKTRSKVAMPFGPDDLRLPVMLYELKKRHVQNSVVMKDLEKATTLLFWYKCDEARIILETYMAKGG